MTFLIDAAHPLTLASEPYASAPAHVSLNLRPLTETQAGEYAAAQSALPKFHRLTVIIKRTNEVTQILRETLLNRGKVSRGLSLHLKTEFKTHNTAV